MSRFAAVAAYIALLLSVVMFFVFVAPLSNYGLDIKEVLSLCHDGERNFCDAIEVANQLGRLDFISALLAVIAIFLAIAAFPFAYYIQRKSREIVEEEVKKKLQTIDLAFDEKIKEIKQSSDEILEQCKIQTDNILNKVEAQTISNLENMLPELVREYMELVENSINDSVADEIASEGYPDEHT